MFPQIFFNHLCNFIMIPPIGNFEGICSVKLANLMEMGERSKRREGKSKEEENKQGKREKERKRKKEGGDKENRIDTLRRYKRKRATRLRRRGKG